MLEYPKGSWTECIYFKFLASTWRNGTEYFSLNFVWPCIYVHFASLNTDVSKAIQNWKHNIAHNTLSSGSKCQLSKYYYFV